MAAAYLAVLALLERGKIVALGLGVVGFVSLVTVPAVDLGAIETLHADNFGEKDEEISKTPTLAPPGPAAVKNGLVWGVPASAGLAFGPAHLYRPVLPKIKTR